MPEQQLESHLAKVEMQNDEYLARVIWRQIARGYDEVPWVLLERIYFKWHTYIILYIVGYGYGIALVSRILARELRETFGVHHSINY